MIQKKEALVKTESQRKGKRCDHAPMLHRYRRESGLSLFDITDLKKYFRPTFASLTREIKIKLEPLIIPNTGNDL